MVNQYHPEEIEAFEVITGFDRRWILNGRDRPLTAVESERVDRGSYNVRQAYCGYVSWLVLDEALIDGLSAYLAQAGIKRIIEPYAGRGLLRKFMMRTGVERWDAYDIAPPEGSDVMQGKAGDVLGAIKPGEFDAILVSWVPYQDEEDCALLHAARAHNIPILWLGEGHYGCTGSTEFWDAMTWECEYPPVRVRTWLGLYDAFMVLRPPPIDPAE